MQVTIATTAERRGTMATKPTAKQLRLQAARNLELEKAREHGHGWFQSNSAALPTEACRYASNAYDSDGQGKDFVLAFLEGFQQARLRRDQWLKEQGE